jgi:hypothetical protein
MTKRGDIDQKAFIFPALTRPRRPDFLSVIRRNTAEVFFSTLVSLLLSTPLIAR